MDGWNTTFLLGRPIFRGYVSFREGRWWFQTFLYFHPWKKKIQSDEHIFQMGWNHQLLVVFKPPKKQEASGRGASKWLVLIMNVYELQVVTSRNSGGVAIHHFWGPCWVICAIFHPEVNIANLECFATSGCFVKLFIAFQPSLYWIYANVLNSR